MKFVSQFLSNWHHGRGSKFTRYGDYRLALQHFENALNYAKKSGESSSVPLELECIARTYARLGEHDNAKRYAEESLNLYKKFQDSGSIFDESVKRVEEFLHNISDPVQRDK